MNGVNPSSSSTTFRRERVNSPVPVLYHTRS